MRNWVINVMDIWFIQSHAIMCLPFSKLGRTTFQMVLCNKPYGVSGNRIRPLKCNFLDQNLTKSRLSKVISIMLPIKSHQINDILQKKSWPYLTSICLNNLTIDTSKAPPTQWVSELDSFSQKERNKILFWFGSWFSPSLSTHEPHYSHVQP